MESDNILTSSELTHREKNRTTPDLVELLNFNLSYVFDMLDTNKTPEQNNLDIKAQCLELAYRIDENGKLR